MRLENRSKEGEMTRELDTRRGTIQELRLSIQRREQEIGESSTEVLKEPRRKVSVFKKSMSSSDVLSVEARSRTQTLASAYSSSTYNPASNPFYPSLDTAQTPAFTDGATGFTDGAAGYTPAPMAGINTILVAKSKLKERWAYNHLTHELFSSLKGLLRGKESFFPPPVQRGTVTVSRSTRRVTPSPSLTA